MKTAKSIINIALKQKGNKGTKYWKYYNVPTGTAWCGIFVSWVFNEANANDLFLAKKKNPAYVPNIDKWGINNGLIVNKNNGKEGDIIIFDWGNDGTRDHVGLIVSKNKNGTYNTIEGNTSGGKVDTRLRYKSEILHLIRPKYDEEPKGKLNLKRVLKRGSTGTAVKNLQKALNKDLGTKLKIDGIFGNSTYKAVLKYQDKYKIDVWRGKVGKVMAHKLGWLWKGK